MTNKYPLDDRLESRRVWAGVLLVFQNNINHLDVMAASSSWGHVLIVVRLTYRISMNIRSRSSTGASLEISLEEGRLDDQLINRNTLVNNE